MLTKSKIIVYSAGRPPIGSWHQRIKMFYLGFNSKGYEFTHIVPYYAPSDEAVKNSPSYIKYCLKPRRKNVRNLFSIFPNILGTLKGAFLLSQIDNVKFVIVPGLNFLQSIFVLFITRLRKIPFYAEIADESGRRYSEEKLTLIDHFAKFNQLIYEKLILKKADKIFVFTSYLEHKYKNMFPLNNNIIRTIPSLIDLTYFDSLTTNNISNIDQSGIELLNSKKIKIVYAGACNRTNGLFFFLDAAAKAKNESKLDFLIFFIFVHGNVNKVKKYCLDKGLSENVLFFNPILPEYIPAIYSKADILLLPEHGDIIANAGFPGKTAELLASGKAIISTNFSDLHYYLQNEQNAMISEIGDDKTYTRNLIRLLSEQDLRTRLGNEARKTALKYFDCKSGINIYL